VKNIWPLIIQKELSTAIFLMCVRLIISAQRGRTGPKHRFTRSYRPQSNAKAGGWIPSAPREWVSGFVWQNAQARLRMLTAWSHHGNWRRPFPLHLL
jgi:transposase InsO family protein